jgi:ATPase family AAA domain-containing protein 3A/B
MMEKRLYGLSLRMLVILGSFMSYQAYGMEADRANVVDPIEVRDIDPITAEEIQDLAEDIKACVAARSSLKNMVFHGSPGIGKNVIVALAKFCGLKLVYLDAEKLINNGSEYLRLFFESTRRLPAPVLICIENAELVLGKRNTMNARQISIMLEFLEHMGSETNNYMVVALAEKVADLDEAFLSRCDKIFDLGVSPSVCRRKVLDRLIAEHLIRQSIPQRQPLLAWFFGLNPSPVQLKIADDALSEAMREAIVAKTKGFTGRHILKMIETMKAVAYATEDCTLTAELINRVVDTMISERDRELTGFSRVTK